MALIILLQANTNKRKRKTKRERGSYPAQGPFITLARGGERREGEKDEEREEEEGVGVV